MVREGEGRDCIICKKEIEGKGMDIGNAKMCLSCFELQGG